MAQATEEKTRQEAILAELDEFVSSSIDEMTPRQVKRFRKEALRIMKESARREQPCADIPETAESRLRAHRA